MPVIVWHGTIQPDLLSTSKLPPRIHCSQQERKPSVLCAHAGINASDINYTAGRYFGSAEVAAKRLPFDAGFESVGAVAAVGPEVHRECPSESAQTAQNPSYSTCLDLNALHA